MKVPAYDRRSVIGSVVHIGPGAFHRSHQAVYLDRLLEAGGDPAWGVCVVGALPGDRPIIDTLAAQDGLYTVVEKHPSGRQSSRVVGSIVEWMFAPDNPDAVVDRLADPRTRIVSLTITEGGYVPGPAFDSIAAALARRRDDGQTPFTVMSCDNLPGNGAIARRTLVESARSTDPSLAAWIEAEVAFPSSMVDRITPASTADNASVVVCEPFLQWALEDFFTAGRPDLESVGVHLVDDVEPYELMKLRLLNAGHQVIAYAGALLGRTLAHEAMGDPDIRGLLVRYLADEGAPSVPEVPGVDLEDYQRQLLERFSNPAIADTVARLCAFTSDRIPQFLLPTVRENLAAGRSVRIAAVVVATWARYLNGTDDLGQPIKVVDHRLDELVAAARDEDPRRFLHVDDLFGDLAHDPRFTGPYLDAARLLRTGGTRQAIARWVGSNS